MKVMLVNSFTGDGDYATPPLGIAYLASSLRKNGIDVDLLDANVLKISGQGLIERIKRSNPDYVGFTALSPTFQSVVKEAKLVKENTECKTILGGPHATLLKEKILENHSEFDFSMVGECEEALPEFLLRGPDGAKGMIHRKDGKVVSTPGFGYIENLDSLPFPARDLLPNSEYFHPSVTRKPFTTMITSRGCPYRCAFCCKPVVGYKYRTSSPEYVMKEIDQLVTDFGIREIIFHDDIFTLDNERTAKICDKMVEGKYDITWKCETRVDRVTPDLLSKMKASGCGLISYGVESGSQQILDNLNKKISTNQIREAFKATKKAGIGTLAYVIIGAPGETWDTVRGTIEFVKELDPEFVQFSFATPFPGTDLFDYAVKNNIIKGEDYSNMMFFGKSAKPVQLSDLNPEELQEAMKLAYRKFYLRPSYMMKMLGKTRNFSQLQEMFRGFKSIIKY